MTTELKTIIDHIRYGASCFNAAGLIFAHNFDNAMDEATQLVLHALHLPHDLSPVYGQSRLTADEKQAVLALIERRINGRKPACYLIGEAWFAGLSFKCDERALVPRSPIAELIENGFEPWRAGRPIRRVLDVCTGGGCIAIAIAHHLPDVDVDGIDISDPALSLANENALRFQLADRVRFIKSDLFSELTDETYDLIVSNPPYVTREQVAVLPDEYRFEPENGLIAGTDGLDVVLRLLRDAPAYLTENGFLICEVGESQSALINLLPQVPFIWVEFKVGQMGVFVIEREDLLTWHREFAALASERE